MNMKNVGLSVIAALVLMFAGMPSITHAGVSVGIGITVPGYTFQAPPPLTVIPGTYAYFAPDAPIDIVFYDGYWYRPYEGRWFRSRGYNGPWRYASNVPPTILELPPDYRHVYRDHPRISYRDHHRNWRTWQKNRYWERDERWREGRHRDRHEEKALEHEMRRHENRY